MPSRKLDIVFFQFNPGLYNNQSYLPYGVGMMWAYAKSFGHIDEAYRNAGFYFVREDPKTIVSRIENADVAAFSTYLWNWEITNQTATLLKQKFPNVKIIIGGPHVPNNAERLLASHPHIDFAVHGEGELTLVEVLEHRITDQQYAEIPSLSYIDGDGFHCKQIVRDPLRELDKIPSPYLTGVFDHLFTMPMQFQAIWETNRGCPYACTFCYWGTDYAFVQKLRQFSMDRLMAEIDYFGDRKINHIYVADANFGIIPRDVEIAERLAEVKAQKNGFPAKFKANYAKNSTERVVQIARILNREKLDRGISLAIQSMDEQALVNVKRRNLRIESFAGFMHKYQQDKIPAYVELILGLPGETYESFRDGVSKLLEAGAHDALFLHKGLVLPNTEMSDPEYLKEHGIQTCRIPASLTHSATHADDVQEYEEMIMATKTMPHEEWRKTFLFAWAMQGFHIMRLTQIPAIYAAVYQNFTYGLFYEALIDYARRHPVTLLHDELMTTQKVMETSLEGNKFDRVLPEFSDILWPVEEATYLRVSMQLDRFFSEMGDFMHELAAKNGWDMEEDLLSDLLAYQQAIIVKYDHDGSQELELQHAVHSFYRDQVEGRQNPLKRGMFRVRVKDDLLYRGDKERFSREIAFWGRRGGQVTYKNVDETEIQLVPA